MRDHVKKHLFEPFFTTKGPAHGTGLGMSIIYGIMEQNKGHIEVESHENKGTIFRIYLPLIECMLPPSQKTPILSRRRITGGNESILLVEDDQGLVRVLEKILKNAGYTVRPRGP